MARKPAINVEQVVRAFMKLSPRARVVVLVVVVVAVAVGAFFYFREHAPSPPTGPGSAPGPPGTYLFCTWNVENLFDDVDDPLNRDDMEDWFGTDPAAFRLKVDRLADALLLMNDGRGPDILALVEVENERCLGALRDAVNARLEAAGKGDQRYTTVLFKEDRTGRRFAPAIVSRLPAIADRTVKLGAGGLQRTLEGHLRLNGHELVVIASHWTSRVRDDTADNRMRYAEACYGRAREIITANPAADVVICGDFNDTLDDPSMRDGLHATGDPQAVRAASEFPMFLDLTAGVDNRLGPKGTIYYEGWSIFDHICVSRGLLDGSGWSCDPKQTEIFAPKQLRTGVRGDPYSFGSPRSRRERGTSDHFPVVTQLRVEGVGQPQP